jgi:hypothetical protein
VTGAVGGRLAILNAVRDEWSRSRPPAARRSDVPRSGSVGKDPHPYEPVLAAEDDVLGALSVDEGEWLALADVQSRVALSKTKLRKRLSELEDARLIEVDRTGRAHRYRATVPNALPPAASASQQARAPAEVKARASDMGPLFADVNRG